MTSIECLFGTRLGVLNYNNWAKCYDLDALSLINELPNCVPFGRFGRNSWYNQVVGAAIYVLLTFIAH